MPIHTFQRRKIAITDKLPSLRHNIHRNAFQDSLAFLKLVGNLAGFYARWASIARSTF